MRSTIARHFDFADFGRNIGCLVAAKQLAAAPNITFEMGSLLVPSQSDHFVRWFADAPLQRRDMMFRLCGQIAEANTFEVDGTTGNLVAEILRPELGDWVAISREIEDLSGGGAILPNELRDLARRVAAKDFSGENIQEWAKRLSQVSLADDE